MPESAEQFTEILAHIISQTNKSLKQSDQVPPMCFGLDKAGKIEIALGVAETREALGSVLNGFQNSLKEKAQSGNIVASGMAFADYGAGCIEALLENNENYCAKYKIPVGRVDGNFVLLTEDIVEEGGSICIFPISDEI